MDENVLTLSGTSTPRPRIFSNTSPSPTWSSSREISTTESSLMIAMLLLPLPSTLPSVLLPPSLEHHQLLLCERSNRTLLSVFPMESERSSTRRSPDGRSRVNMPSSCSQRDDQGRSLNTHRWMRRNFRSRWMRRCSPVTLT